MATPNWASTPTQYENDLAALGVNTNTHEWDGSPVDPKQSFDPTQPPGGPAVVTPLPVITTLAPTTGPLPNVDLIVTGTDFAVGSVVVFNRVTLPTTRTSATEVRASVKRFDGPV